MAWLGEHRVFIVEEFIKNGGSPVATQRAFLIHFGLGRREAFPYKKTIYRWVSNFRQTGSALKQTSPGQPQTATVPEKWQLSGLRFRNPHGVLHANMRLHYGCLTEV